MSWLVKWRYALAAPFLARKARRLDDPVEKLKYLRRQAGLLEEDKWVRWEQKFRRPAVGFAVVLIVVQGISMTGSKAPVAAATGVAAAKAFVEAPVGKVWLVETRNGVELFSNGLRVETKYAVRNRPRSYVPLNRTLGNQPSRAPHTAPVGIVYHTTESQLVDMQPEKNGRLRNAAEGTVQYVQDKRAYHFVIDRFGRVWRVVDERDAAWHAGRSVWADAEWTWIDLNDPFLGISFETQTRTLDEQTPASPAQIQSARQLTEMLRAKYGIKSRNCATHAQVSVNVSNMRIGYHTDWAGNFPFHELGLPDNYEVPLPALEIFGFGYDPTFLASTGARMWKGVLSAEDRLNTQAKQRNTTVAEVKAALRRQFRETAALLPVPPERQASKAGEEGEQ
jgi:hypothetical protein